MNRLSTKLAYMAMFTICAICYYAIGLTLTMPFGLVNIIVLCTLTVSSEFSRRSLFDMIAPPRIDLTSLKL